MSRTGRSSDRGARKRGRVALALLLVGTAMAIAFGWARWPDRDDGAETVRVERSAYAMGTTLSVTVEAAGRQRAVDATEVAVREVARIEGLISSWDSTTALARLNRAEPGRPVRPPAEVLGILAEAWAWADSTGRAFEPAVGPLVDAWGLRTGGRTPSVEEVEKALASVRAGFTVDSVAGTVVRNAAGAWIDAGAFGKGAGLRAAGRALRSAGVELALLDLGGQGLAIGAPAGREGWRIAVAHPARRTEAVARLELQDASVATSGASERPGHLLDPRSGAPLPAWGSVTVATASPLAADALATALFVLGPEGARRWAEDRAEVGVLVLESEDSGLASWWNEAMGAMLVEPPASGR